MRRFGMDISNVFVILGSDWTKELVINEIKLEGYKHNFYFSDKNFGKLSMEDEINKLLMADEVWCFGHCNTIPMYHYAQKNNKDIWRMG